MTEKFGTPLWWQDGAQLPDLSNTPPQRVEFLIVGAGYTGLSAAITLAENGARVLVVDAGVPGKGASTRNGGMVGAHPRESLEKLTQKFGATIARGIYSEASPAFDNLRNLIDRHDIDCNYQQTGRIQLAWTKSDFTNQKIMAQSVNEHTQSKVKVVPKSEITKHVNTKHYFGGIHFLDHGALHPRKLHDGMMQAALNAGVEIIQNCPIQSITRSRVGFCAEWAKGSITADQVILATNGYTKGKGTLRYISRRVFPLPSYMVATEQLDPAMINKLAPGGRMMVETRARFSYWRISPDGTRIIWGGRAAIVNISPKKAAARIKKTMDQIWPDMKPVSLTHSWSGNTGYTFNHTPSVGQIDGVYYATGYCGGGVVMAPYLGMKVAYQAMNDARGQTAYSDAQFASKPYHIGGYPWFLQIANAWYSQVVDRRQNMQAKRDHHGK